MRLVRRSTTPVMLLVLTILTFLGLSALSAEAEVGVTEAGVTAVPRTDTMQVIDGEVLDSVVIGNRVFVVGTFTQVRNAEGGTINQPYIAAYNADTGRFDGAFRPDVDDFVNAVATDGNAIYIVGQFSNAGGEAHRRIAKFNTDGNINSNFNASFSATPNTLAVAHGKVYVGGQFTSVNTQPREAFAAVDSTTGAVDSVTNFDFEDSTQPPPANGISVRWIEVSPNGNFLFLTHSARLIDGQIRTGVARFEVSPATTRLSVWQTNLYENELDDIIGGLRMRRLAIATNNSYVVVVAAGGDQPPSNDTAVRFPSFGTADVRADWVSRHFDSMLGVTVSDDVVYVGGHFQFQEAQGSDNPFPGDANTFFDFGANQGPQVLGSQVVQREQLGSLNPLTGKSLDWNPGSDSFIGVQSLTWDDQYGLLVGHDGNRLGGVNNIGRHAIFPLGQTPNNGGELGGNGGGNGSLACTTTFNDNNATINLTGDLGSSINLLRNDNWVATLTGNTATITANQGDTITSRVRGSTYPDPFHDITCTTGNNGGGGNGGADTTLLSPANGAVLGAGLTTISGEAAARQGVGRVRLTVQRRETAEYLTPDGEFVPEWTPIDIDFNNAPQSTTWATDVKINFVDTYDVIARTFDAQGTRVDRVSSSFLIGFANDAPPEIRLDPVAVAPPKLTISGSATDDIGVVEVTFLVANRNTAEFFRVDGTLGAAERHTAILSNPGGTATNWSQTLDGIPPGEWQILVDVVDSSGQRDRVQPLIRVG